MVRLGAGALSRWHLPFLNSENGPRSGVDVGVQVDGETGEAYFGFYGPAEIALNARLGYYRMTVGGYTFEPEYPGRVIGGVPYLYAGYLDSKIWQVRNMELSSGHVAGSYSGKVFSLSADSPRLLLGEGVAQLPHPPRTFHERLYLPAEAIAAITGWQVTFDKKMRTLVLVCPTEATREERRVPGADPDSAFGATINHFEYCPRQRSGLVPLH